MIVPGELSSLSTVRSALGEALDEGGWDEDGRGIVLLATCEALTNAIEHGSRPAGWVEVGFRVDRRAAHLRIADEGRPGAATPSAVRAAPPVTSLRGRGLVIMRALADRLEVRPHEGGTEVTMDFVHRGMAA